MRVLILIISIFLIFWGISGFIPFFVKHDYLFQIFYTNSIANLLHLGAGIFGLAFVFSNKNAQRFYFQILGIFFAAWALLGFFYGEKEIFGWIANNSPDNWLHVIISISALIKGYGGKDHERNQRHFDR